MTLMGLQLAPVNDQNVKHGRDFAPVSLYSQRGGRLATSEPTEASGPES
jgi:hypothetical protein